jgi:GT2 family glycosyltransferase
MLTGRAFEISARDQSKPAYFAIENMSEIAHLVEICKEESALIDDDIRRHLISRPKNIPQRRPETRFSIREVPCLPRKPSEGLAKDRKGTSTVATAARGVRRRAVGAAQLPALAKDILRAAKPGPVVVVGMGWQSGVLEGILRMAGRQVVRLESGYGKSSPWIAPGVLRRPAEGSFLWWLSADAVVRLEGAGCIVLLDKAGAADDLAVLVGLEYRAPPIIAPLSTPLGAAAPRRASQDYEPIVFGATAPCSQHDADPSWPKISIVTVSFNQAKFLEKTIRSVLDQAYPNLEYIVVDGGSSDGSIEIIEKYRPHFAHVVIERDEGQSDALNKGFGLATGDVMNWLCSDDMLEPGALARIGGAYRRCRPELIVGGCIRIGDSRNDELARHHSALPFGRIVPMCFPDMLQFMRSWQNANYFFQPEVFFSRAAWESSGAFLKRHLYYAMDYDLWLRMAMAGATAVHLPDMIGCSRVHSAQKTQSDRVYLHQLRQLMEEYCDLFQRVAALDAGRPD